MSSTASSPTRNYRSWLLLPALYGGQRYRDTSPRVGVRLLGTTSICIKTHFWIPTSLVQEKLLFRKAVAIDSELSVSKVTILLTTSKPPLETTVRHQAVSAFPSPQGLKPHQPSTTSQSLLVTDTSANKHERTRQKPPRRGIPDSISPHKRLVTPADHSQNNVRMQGTSVQHNASKTHNWHSHAANNSTQTNHTRIESRSSNHVFILNVGKN